MAILPDLAMRSRSAALGLVTSHLLGLIEEVRILGLQRHDILFNLLGITAEGKVDRFGLISATRQIPFLGAVVEYLAAADGDALAEIPVICFLLSDLGVG